MSRVFPEELGELLERRYVRWTGAQRAKTKGVDALLTMGFIEWTTAGCEARARRIRELKISLGFRRPDEMPPDTTAGEEHRLP